MKRERKKIGLVLAAACALGMSTAAGAEDVSVMAIGDSLTWGFSFTDGSGSASTDFQSNGGFRSPLESGLNSNPSLSGFTYNFVGQKGDGVLAAGENNHRTDADVAPDNLGDGLDGPSNTTALHEGYSGWFIDSAAYGGQAGLVANNRGGVRDIISDSGAAGTINPSNADVIMLMIGTNDLITHSAFGGTQYANISEIVDQLGLLIDDIAAIAPDSTIVVSTLLPTVTNKTPFTAGDDLTDQMNTDYDAFNAEVLADFFGGVWQDDSLGTDVWAEHDTLDNVILVDANSAIDRSLAGGDIETFGNDFTHLTTDGYADLAAFYEDRFEALNIVPSPSSAAVLAVLGGMAMFRRRRDSRA